MRGVTTEIFAGLVRIPPKIVTVFVTEAIISENALKSMLGSMTATLLARPTRTMSTACGFQQIAYARISAQY